MTARWRQDDTNLLSGSRVIRSGPASLRVRPRTVVVGAVLSGVVFLAAAVHIAFGGSSIPFDQVVRAVVGLEVDSRIQLAVTEFRAPRTVAAVIAGSCLAAAGAITQTISRNPLATPDILGVTAGASLGAVTVLVAADGGAAGLQGPASVIGLPLAAFGGGTLAALAVYWLSGYRTSDSYRLVLVGLGVNGLAVALTTWMLTLGDVTSAAQVLTWMSGSLNGKDWPLIAPMGAVAAALLIAAAGAVRWLDLMGFDDDVAVGIGVRVTRLRPSAFALATVLASAAVIVAGPLAFVALASPQIARMLAGSAAPPIIPSALIGAGLVLVADAVAAHALPVALPAGVATAVLGAPYLIYLVLRYQRSLM